MKKRTLQELSEEQEEINSSYINVNSLQKQLYLENQKRLEEIKQEKQEIKQNEGDEVKQVDEKIKLCFPVGKFCLNQISQYPKEEKQSHILSFINIIQENAYSDVQKEKPKITLEAALMTCYGFEDHLLKPLVLSGVKLFIINDNDNNDKKLEIIEEFNGHRNWTVIKPSKLSSVTFGGSFHPKIWILKFPKFIRIVIGSQNLHVGDWTVWSQAMWIQDFQIGNSELDEISKEFKVGLKEFLDNILPNSHKFEDLLKIKYNDYDFQNINIRLITSIPGRFTGNQMNKYGMMRIQSVINSELKSNDFEIPKQVSIAYQTTSIGQLDVNYIDFVQQCCSGQQVKQSQKIQQNNKSIAQMLFNQQEEEKSTLKLIYPTSDYIQNQTSAGPEYANPLFLRKQQYENPKFPKNIFHRYQGSNYYYWHAGNIPHLKVMIVTGIDEKIDDKTSIYIGSHNLSQAAWGRLEKNATQLFISNTELGVLYPPKKDSAKLKQSIVEQISFKFPPDKYEKTDQPWISEVYYEQQI
ncbi:unnamed protein product [Paramecium octaurelia]|uniref:Tyrosyl-DNA phosphodiesterase n=1 Tax=Paramecium octaurelia TaxID=43137 RepID=A0A8S1RSC3_PAROT|nr:unnamed protein product [Paramecium octaurelia]